MNNTRQAFDPTLICTLLVSPGDHGQNELQSRAEA
jgi:hypothetical protein